MNGLRVSTAGLGLRVTAFVTLFVFTTTSLVWADGLQPLMTSLDEGRSEAPPEQAHDWASKSFFQALTLPDSIGQIKQNFQGTRDRIVIHIQDAHANEEAQRNIAKIIDYFARHYDLKLVNLEGGQGELFTEALSFFPNKKALGNVADYFLREARLTGPQHLAILRRPDLMLFGVEDKQIYEQNRQAYLEAVDFRERDVEILADVEKVLDSVSRFVFSEELRRILKARTNFETGGRELVGYIRLLVDSAKQYKIALHDFPDMHSLLELVELERQIDFDAAELETDSLIEDMKQLLSRDRLSRFLTNTVQFRMKKMKRAEYYGYLENQIGHLSEAQAEESTSALDTKYENVLKYLRYMQLYDSIDLAIFEEIQALERAIKNKLFRSEDEITLDRLYRVFEIYRKMFEFTLTKHDADFYYTYRNEFKANTFRKFLTPLLKEHHFSYGLPPRMEILDQDLARIERFYTTALKRDQILIERAVKKMEDEKESISVIVTGGFHTPGIETYLREQDYSYLIIAPRVEKKIDPEQSTRRYEDAIRQKPLPLEKLLMESYFLPSMTAIQNPQFQLAAELLLPNKEDEWERFVGHLASGRSTRGDEGKFNMLVDFISLVTADSAISGNPGEEIEAIRSELRKLPEIDRQPLDRLINRFSGVSFSHGVGSERVDYLFLPVLGEPNKLLAIASLPQAPDGRENRLYSEVRTQLRLRRNAFPVPLDTHILLFSSVIDRDRSPIFIPRAVDQALRVLAEELELASRAPQAVSISEEPKEVSEAEERPTDRQRDKKLLEEAREQFKTFRQTFGELGAWTDQEQRALQYHIFQLARRELGVPKPGGVAILPDGYDYELGYELGVPAAESLFYFSPAVKSWIASQLPYAWGAVSKEPFAIAPSLPSRVIEALDSPETFRFEVLLQGIRSDAAFSAYFLNALSNLTRHADVLDSLNLLPGDLWQNGEQGYIVVPYDEDVTDIRFLNRIADRAEREAPKSILRIIVPPELKSVASDLRSELRGRVEIQVDDLGRHVRGLEKRVANIIQIRAGPLRHLDIEMLQASLLGAVALSQGTILVLGADEQVSSYAIVVDSVEILQDMLLSVLEAQKAA